MGAYWEDQEGSNSGSVYLFTLSGSTWSQHQKIVGSAIAANENFGFNVAIDGTMVLASTQQTGPNASVYAFDKSGANWAETQVITVPGDASSVVFAGDLALDSSTFGIAARQGGSGNWSNFVHVYELNGSTWEWKHQITPPDGSTNSSFGRYDSLSIDGDVIGVGRHTTNEAFLFNRTAVSTWAHKNTITSSDSANDDRFGWSVALSSDDLLVGFFGSKMVSVFVIRHYRYHPYLWRSA